MKKIFTLVTLVLAAVFTASAQLLWQVSRPGDAEAPVSYILGTYHLIGYDKVDSITGLSEVLERVDRVVGELDMEQEQSMESQMKIAMYATAPEDSTLSMLYTPSQLDSIQMAFDQYLGGVRVSQFDNMKPAFLDMLLEVARAAQLGGTVADPVDIAVQTRARALGKGVEGLETIDEQCLALFGGNIVAQAESLLWGATHDTEMKSTARRLFEAYLHGDLNEMLSIIEEDESADATEIDRLVNRRNTDWLRVLAGFLPAASLLIVVGAGHLPGEKGLLKGLQKLGFDVTPVN